MPPRTNRVNQVPIEERRTQVYELALTGMTMRQIGRELGISPSTVCLDVKAAIAEIPPAERAHRRQITDDRYNRWLMLIHDAIDNGEDVSKLIPVAVAIETARARLFALNDEAATAPPRSSMHLGEVTVEIARMVREAREASEADEAAIRGQ